MTRHSPPRVPSSDSAATRSVVARQARIRGAASWSTDYDCETTLACVEARLASASRWPIWRRAALAAVVAAGCGDGGGTGPAANRGGRSWSAQSRTRRSIPARRRRSMSRCISRIPTGTRSATARRRRTPRWPPPALPEAGGRGSLTGTDGAGTELFSLSFAMSEFHRHRRTSVPGSRSPCRSRGRRSWPRSCCRVRVARSASTTTTDRPMTILRDPATGPDPWHPRWHVASGTYPSPQEKASTTMFRSTKRLPETLALVVTCAIAACESPGRAGELRGAPIRLDRPGPHGRENVLLQRREHGTMSCAIPLMS